MTRGGHAERIIVSSILNRDGACSACGWFAGIRIISPPGTRSARPAIRDFRFSFQHLYHRVERRGVFAQSLTFVKREQRHGAGAALSSPG